MKTNQEKELEQALKKAIQYAEHVEEMTRTVPPIERTALLRSTNSMVTNLAMALDVLRRRRAAAGDQV